MSNAAAATDAAPPPKGKKKLIIIIAAVVLLVVVGAVVAMLMMKKAPAEDGEEGGHAEAKPAAAAPAPKAAPKHDPKHPPVFVPLEPFTVNLADRETERYAQVGLTLEVTDAAVGDAIKVYLPAIRNNILMALADKTASQLMDREGKAKLAEKIRRETARAMGYEVEDDEEEEAAEDTPKKKKKKPKRPVALPIEAVHFSNFIIQ